MLLSVRPRSMPVAEPLAQRQIGSLLLQLRLYIGLQDRANAATPFTARKPHSALRPIARPTPRSRPLRRTARRRPHPRQPRTRYTARRSPHHCRKRLRRTRIRRPDSRPRRPRHLYLRLGGAPIHSRAAHQWQRRRHALGIAIRRRARRGRPEPPDAGSSARLDCVRHRAPLGRILPGGGIPPLLQFGAEE